MLGAAGLAAFLAAVAGLSSGVAGRGASPRASAGATHTVPSRRATLGIVICNPAPGDGAIMACPGQSPDLPSGMTPEQYAAAKVQSQRMLRALASIDFCGPTDQVACPSDPAPPPVCGSGPCPRRTSPRGVRRVVPGDVAVIQAALDRAGFPGAEVRLIDDPPGVAPMIRYAVPAGPLCLTGIMFNTDPPRGNDLSGIGPSGHC